MPMKSGLKLTSKEKVLLHLKDFWQYRESTEFPSALTQKGISEMTGLRLTHVPRTLKRMLSEDLVNELKGHVQGESRRYKVYFLTEKGALEAARILEHLKTQKVMIEGNEKTVGEILEGEKEVHQFHTLLRITDEDVSSIKRQSMMAGPVPETSGFVNREEELAQLNEMLEIPDLKVMVIYGSQGYGTTALAANFIRSASNKWSVCWVNTSRNLDDLGKSIMKALNELYPETHRDKAKVSTGDALARILDGKKVVLVCDGYFDVSDGVVEFFSGLVSAIKNTEDFKLLVTIREDTPSYNRFYTILDIHDGLVGEVHIRGLDMEHCKLILGTPNIEPDALKRLFLFTRGNPTTLKLLYSENVQGLKEKINFSPEEIKLMLFLKSQIIS